MSATAEILARYEATFAACSTESVPHDVAPDDLRNLRSSQGRLLEAMAVIRGNLHGIGLVEIADRRALAEYRGSLAARIGSTRAVFEKHRPEPVSGMTLDFETAARARQAESAALSDIMASDPVLRDLDRRHYGDPLLYVGRGAQRVRDFVADKLHGYTAKRDERHRLMKACVELAQLVRSARAVDREGVEGRRAMRSRMLDPLERELAVVDARIASIADDDAPLLAARNDLLASIEADIAATLSNVAKEIDRDPAEPEEPFNLSM